MPTIGVGQVSFKSKVHTAIGAKGEETKRLAERDPSVKKTTRTLHDGRKETVLTKKLSAPAVKVCMLLKIIKSTLFISSFSYRSLQVGVILLRAFVEHTLVPV